MDDRAAKLALARKKLKDHQEKKSGTQPKELIYHTSEIKTLEYNVEPIILKEEQIQTEIDNDNMIQNNNIDSKVTMCNDTEETNVSPQIYAGSINATEILISSKRNLEIQVDKLQAQLSNLQEKYTLAQSKYNSSHQIIHNLENDIKNIKEEYGIIRNQLVAKEHIINELVISKTSLSDENNNYKEQLEFTKSILTAKEAENSSLHSQLFNVQTHLETVQLQLQQLTNGTDVNLSNSNKTDETQQNEVLTQKITTLEQQLKDLQKERHQISVHYEHYVSELNEQLKSAMQKNEDLTAELQHLSNRENSLIEQISEMEIRLQNYHIQPKITDDAKFERNNELHELQNKHEELQHHFQDLNIKYKELEKHYVESNEKIKELSHHEQANNEQDTLISISKLNADIASDKLAAQRATEQNKKLKQDIQGLEDAFVKMTKDKLELTEKLTAEKYLNRQLTIRLAEIEEKTKDMQVKLKAKDEEMIRLQASYRHLEKYDKPSDTCADSISLNVIEHDIHETIAKNKHDNENVCSIDNSDEINLPSNVAEHPCSPLISNKTPNMAREDAMQRLQQRFLKIMAEVADLSDEKHRLEHIILQLQNETETICEYVALYQQQRSLLKRRDEERSAQIKMFEAECEKLKTQIDELTAILVKLSQDKELSQFLKTESKNNDIQRVMKLLLNLKSNSLIDPYKKNVDFKNFYPCNCCSGKLIEI